VYAHADVPIRDIGADLTTCLSVSVWTCRCRCPASPRAPCPLPCPSTKGSSEENNDTQLLAAITQITQKTLNQKARFRISIHPFLFFFFDGLLIHISACQRHKDATSCR
jgi:hypothetical protein